jgi:hypothetical protein
MRSVGILVTVLIVATLAAGVWMHGVPGLAAHLKSLHSTAADVAPAPATAVVAANTTPELDGWPATRAGEIAHRWVRSFNTGEKAMKECLTDIMATESLKKTAMPARVERYRDLRERFGTLTLVSIDSSDPYKVSATLAATDLSQRHFTFEVQTRAPYKLLTVSMMEPHFGTHGFGH